MLLNKISVTQLRVCLVEDVHLVEQACEMGVWRRLCLWNSIFLAGSLVVTGRCSMSHCWLLHLHRLRSFPFLGAA
jgi:hypothetical protein